MEDVKKILVVTLSNIGDVVLTLPVIGSLRENFKDATIDVVAGSRASELLEADPRIGKLYVYDKSSTLASKIMLLARLRRNRYDLLVDLRNSLFGLFVGARYCPAEAGLCNKRSKGGTGEVCHKIDEHLAKIRELGVAAGGPYPVWIGREDSERASRLLTEKGILGDDKYICVSPGAKSHIKRWREDGFAEACDMLIDAFKVKIVFVGDASDKEICEKILGKMRNYAVSAAGLTNLRELAYIIKRSQLLVTNDSAPLHIAGSVGTPAVAIFGPTDSRKYGPRPGAGSAVFKELHCSPCETALCRYNLECMKAVSADEVFDAAKKILDERK